MIASTGWDDSPVSTEAKPGWQFWIDRGGTFTDVVARRPDGHATPQVAVGEPASATTMRRCQASATCSAAAAAQRSRQTRSSGEDGHHRRHQRAARAQGRADASRHTSGFGDALRIGYQARPELFALDIVLPEMLYDAGRRDRRAGRAPRRRCSPARSRRGCGAELAGARDDGFVRSRSASCTAIATPTRGAVAAIARALGFTQVSVSHEVSPLMKLVGRGDTTVVDAYLSPILRRYVDQVAGRLGRRRRPSMFMQSNGGLTDARRFQGKDCASFGPGRRRRRHASELPRRRLRPHHRLRHGRHLDRRVALRRRARAHLRDRGRRGPRRARR